MFSFIKDMKLDPIIFKSKLPDRTDEEEYVPRNPPPDEVNNPPSS